MGGTLAEMEIKCCGVVSQLEAIIERIVEQGVPCKVLELKDCMGDGSQMLEYCTQTYNTCVVQCWENRQDRRACMQLVADAKKDVHMVKDQCLLKTRDGLAARKAPTTTHLLFKLYCSKLLDIITELNRLGDRIEREELCAMTDSQLQVAFFALFAFLPA